MLSYLRNMSISLKMSAMAFLGYLLFGAIIFADVLVTMETTLLAEAQEKVNVNAGLARALLERAYGKDYSIVDGQLYIGSHKVDGDNKMIDDAAALMGGVMTVFKKDLRVATNIVNPKTSKRAVGTKLARNAAYDSVFTDKKIFFGQANILGEDYLTAYDPIVASSGEVLGIIFVGIKKDKQLAIIHDIVSGIGYATLIIAFVLGGLTFLTISMQMKPLIALQSVMSALQKEDVSVEVKNADRGDEVGMMARAVQSFKETVIERIQLRKEQAEAEARQEEERKRMMHEMADNFEQSVKGVVAGVSSAATEMQGSAKSLSGTAEETTRQAGAVGSAAESAASGVQTVASAAEELNASIAEITNQTNETVRVAGECVREAEATSADVQELSKAAEDIESVVSLIEDIASQVNLLALNATIEAARAGEAGKGFAVVANEVKNLAAQTGDATKEIATQIANIQEKTKHAVLSIGTISETIKKVNEISTTVASAAEEQGAATQEISRSVQKTSQDTDEVSQNISGVSRAAAETSTASGQMLETADQLAKESETLRSTVDEFIAHIRQA